VALLLHPSRRRLRLDATSSSSLHSSLTRIDPPARCSAAITSNQLSGMSNSSTRSASIWRSIALVATHS
jgi:hypothetical protein